MSIEFIALIGIGVTVIYTGVALAALILNTQRNQREEIKTLREETQAGFKAVREEIQAQREETKTEFKTQRETIISLLERMAHLGGLLESLPLRS